MLYRNYIKRLLDILLSLLALAFFSPMMLTVALLVRKRMGSPVIFRQKRIGRGNKEFLLRKFRTMTEERDENGVYLPDTQRLTPLGRFLRSTSIDELPTLINVLRGEMSIIGPRPLPVRYLARYSREQRRRHEVRPGLSSVSVVNGRNAMSWENQFDMDVWYVDHMSFFVDVSCILSTVAVVCTRKGAVAEDGGSRGEFIGTADIATLIDVEKNYMKLG